MKQFELTLVYRTSEGKVITYDKIEVDDLLSLLNQFQFVIVNLARKTNLEVKDDDIPF